jgi:opacity protein-like surface antigen
MKKFLLALLAALSLAVVAPAQADTYLQVSGGPTFDPTLSFGCCNYGVNTGYNIGGAVGTDLAGWLGPDWAVQGDIFYTKSQYTCCSGNDLATLSLTGNLVYNWHNNSPFTPYIGAGIGGVDDMYTNVSGASADGWAFAYQFFVGVDWAAFQNVSVFGEYRYQGSSNTTISGSYGTEGNIGYASNNLVFGLRLHL